MASVIGYHLYKKRLRDRGDSIRFSNQDLIPDNNESREGLNPLKVKTKREMFNEESIFKLETAVFMDAYSFMNKYMVGNKEKAIQYILATMNMASMIFKHPSLGMPVELYIVKVILMINQPSELKTDGRWQDYLDIFCKYQASKNSPGTNVKDKRWDNALLYTGIDLFDDKTSMIEGGAQVGTICHESLSCAIIEGGIHKGYSIFKQIAHEVGHNLGFGHDDLTENPACINKGYIMDALLTDRLEFWSPCSRELFLNTYNSSKNKYNCFYDAPKLVPEYNLYNIPNYGYKISLDEQCSINQGINGFYQKSVKIPVCELLSCGKLAYIGWTQVSAGGPALEMSYCGENSWCQSGKCVPIPASVHNQFGPPIPIDGKWGPWLPYERCINTDCIAGAQLLEYWIRTCSNPFPHFGGKQCIGDDASVKLAAIKCRRPYVILLIKKYFSYLDL
ncbi:unnamed protein product [Gordionus sp. m RMFG-2023]